MSPNPSSLRRPKVPFKLLLSKRRHFEPKEVKVVKPQRILAENCQSHPRARVTHNSIKQFYNCLAILFKPITVVFVLIELELKKIWVVPMPMPQRVMDDAFSFQRSLEADFFFKLQVQSSVDHDLSLYFTTLNSLFKDLDFEDCCWAWGGNDSVNLGGKSETWKKMARVRVKMCIHGDKTALSNLSGKYVTTTTF